MRIAMISPLEMRVPPVAYGGTELVVSLLTEALIRRGHKVALFASGDSVTQAELIPGSDSFLRGLNKSSEEKHILEIRNIVNCLGRADQFDIIHNHSSPWGMVMAGFSRTPVLTTLHNQLTGEEYQVFLDYKGWYNTISESYRKSLPKKENFAGVIYNAIDCQSFPFNEGEREGYLLFLASLGPKKAPHLAIEVAKRLKRKLLLAGNIYPADESYFRRDIEPQIDGKLIQYFGEADSRQKRELLSQADCLIAPITWPEPFGLYFIEAMAAGTPVVTFSLGAAPEVVHHGETGFVVNNLDEMVAAVKSIHGISRKYCRKHAEKHFNVERMVDDYLKAYEFILKES